MAKKLTRYDLLREKKALEQGGKVLKGPLKQFKAPSPGISSETAELIASVIKNMLNEEKKDNDK